MRIFIPSASRSEAEKVHVGPVADFSPLARQLTTYVVPNEQVADYHYTLQQTGLLAQGVSVVGCAAQGIAATRHWIGGECAERGEEKFAMVDDDVRFVRRISPDATSLIKCVPADVDQMWSAVVRRLETYAHVGVSARQGNNNMGVGSPDEVAEENTRTLRVLCYRTKDFLKAKHGRVPVMEDFDVNLQLLRMGLPNINLGWWSQDQKMTNAPGGCSTYRSHQLHEQAAHKLAELHDPYVKLRQKVNKTGGEFGTRTEVTIYWKKAFGRG
jgi:hypothetical protein